MFDYLNEVAEHYQPLLEAVKALLSLFIGAGLLFVGLKVNEVAKSNLELAKEKKDKLIYKISEKERDIFRSNYQKVSEALGLVLREGNVSNDARELFWKARDEARLELPQDIQDYTESLFKEMLKAYNAHHFLLYEETDLSNNERREHIAEQHSNAINFLMNTNPNEVYSQYMKIS